MEDFDPNFLWGEIQETREEEKVPKELADIVAVEAIKMETSKTKQPQPQQGAGNDIIIGPEHSTMEENVLYTISLIKHGRKVLKLIDQARSSTSGDITPCPPMPFKSDSIREKQTKGLSPLRHIERKDTPFTLGEPVYLPDIGKEIAKEILLKCVATICAHAGFDTAMQIPLQTLTDVAENYFLKLTALLRFATDREALHGKAGFPDPIERVFHEMGIGSVTTMLDFYQKRVLQYRDQCESRSLRLVQQYEALIPKSKTGQKEKSDKNIPKLHLPATAAGGCEDEPQSSLEPGFQMLQSLK